MNRDFRVGDVVELRVNDKFRMVVAEIEGQGEYVECVWLDTLGHMQREFLRFQVVRNYSAESRKEAKTNPAHREWLIKQGMETE